jgi:thiamine-monophosphate kinase
MNRPVLNEFELIARLTAGLPSRTDVVVGVGDDCAILDIQGNLLLLATCDSQVEGVHFTFQFAEPEAVGRKALAVNLSDIAAMGGVPRYALVSLILPSHLSVEIVEGIYNGLREEARRYATAIVGGNVAGAGKAEQLVIDITLLGTVERGQVLTRSGARVGDTLCVTGYLGDAAAGLYTFLHPAPESPQEDLKILQTAFRLPQPRVREGQILSQFGPGVVTAMLDISDGLSGDLEHLCTRSHVGARIELDHLPLSPAASALAADVGHNPLDWALHGGEDYELLFTISAGNEQKVVEAVRSQTGTLITAIGTIVSQEEGMQLVYPDGHKETVVPRSWDHLRTPEQD